MQNAVSAHIFSREKVSQPAELYGRPWGEREYIIVLHFYFKHQGEPRHIKSEFVLELAQLLGRTPSAVVMRLENFASLDPSVMKSGLPNIGPLGIRVFNEWEKKQESLHACAGVLVRDVHIASRPTLFDPTPVRVPKAFGKYELLDFIGEGAFGSVYSCVNSDDQKVYAIKIIRTDQIYSPEMLGRFRREIRVLKSHNHPNVICVREDNLEEQKDFPAFVMDYADCSLTEYMQNLMRKAGNVKSRPVLPPEDARKILESIFAAAISLHDGDRSVIHRDINPNNILRMPDGGWVLADFSLAKFIESGASSTTFATKSKFGFGTEFYTAPEQWNDFGATDHKVDVYSLGVLTWELLSTSGPPFDRAYLGLPSTTAEIVLRATDRNPDRRFDSVSEFHSVLMSTI